MKHSIATTLRALQDRGIPDPVEEFRFAPPRRWRIDRAWPDWLPRPVAWEIEGVTVSGGRHQRVAGFAGDCEKYNELALRGWLLIRTTPRQIESGEALAWLARALGLED